MGWRSDGISGNQSQSRFTNIKFGLMVGIGGGVPSVELDIRLGDVVVSHPYQQHGGVVQYDFGKTMTKGHMRTGWLNAPPPVLLSAIVEQRARHFRQQSTFKHHLARFDRPGLESFTRKSTDYDWLFNATYEHPGGPDCRNCSNVEKVQRPVRLHGVDIYYGTIASGNQVMKDGIKRDEISKELGGVMCFEMEAAGLMNDFPCLVIRGICDYADSHKNKTWQPYAAATAAACAKEILTIVPALPEPAPTPLGRDPESGQTRVEMKLDLLMRELQLGYRTPGQIAQDIKKDLIDDNVTEVDVEENREFIDEWLKSTKANGWLGESVQEQPHASDERPEDRLPKNNRGHAPGQKSFYSNRKQVPRENFSDEDEEWSDKESYLLSDAETEVGEEHRISPDLQNPSRPGSVLDDTRKDKPVRSRSRQEYNPPNKKTLHRKRRANARDRVDAAEDTHFTRDDSRSPSPVLRRRRRQPHNVQDQYAESYMPAQPQTDPYYPRYESNQWYPMSYYPEPTYRYGQDGYGKQPYYGYQYNDARSTIPRTYPPPQPRAEEYTNHEDAAFDRSGRFFRYGHADPHNAPSYNNRSRPAPSPEAYRAAEQPAGNPLVPENSDKTSYFPTRSDSNKSAFNISDHDNIFAEFLRSTSGNGNGNDDGFGFGIFDRPLNAPPSPRTSRPPRAPQNEVTIVEKQLPITLEEMFRGTTKKMKITRKTYNQATGRTATEDRILEVPIKKGLKAGSKIKFSDVGDQVEGGTQDLHFVVTEVTSPATARMNIVDHESRNHILCSNARVMISTTQYR